MKIAGPSLTRRCDHRQLHSSCKSNKWRCRTLEYRWEARLILGRISSRKKCVCHQDKYQKNCLRPNGLCRRKFKFASYSGHPNFFVVTIWFDYFVRLGIRKKCQLVYYGALNLRSVHCRTPTVNQRDPEAQLTYALRSSSPTTSMLFFPILTLSSFPLLLVLVYKIAIINSPPSQWSHDTTKIVFLGSLLVVVWSTC